MENTASGAASPLHIWMNALVRYVQSNQPDLTNRQLALLLTVYLTPGPHTVRGLATRLSVSKPVITRALNTLSAMGYLKRHRDETDLRNVLVEHTDSGHAFLRIFEKLLEEANGKANVRKAGQDASRTH